jgi:hypothetical protein
MVLCNGRNRSKAREELNMEFGPISGIRSVSLFSPRKAEKDDSPHFEVDASPQAGDDEAFTPSQDEQSNTKGNEQEAATSTPEPAPQNLPEPVENQAETKNSWFV